MNEPKVGPSIAHCENLWPSTCSTNTNGSIQALTRQPAENVMSSQLCCRIVDAGNGHVLVDYGV